MYPSSVIESGKCLNVKWQRTIRIRALATIRIKTSGMAIMATEKVVAIQKMILITTKAEIGDAAREWVVKRVKKTVETMQRNHMTRADHTILETRHIVIRSQQAMEGVVPVPITILNKLRIY